jgi:dynein heavy chain 2
LNNVQQIQIKSLILDSIHFVAVVDELISNNVNQNVQNWYWQKQLRYYYSASSTVKVCMGCSELNYSFEYLGCFNKLVHTPLTDKCFLTCMQALIFGLGVNALGPAGKFYHFLFKKEI